MTPARQKTLMRAAMVLLVAESAILAFLPTPRLPRPARVLAALVNLVAVAALWLATRQRFSAK
jgi:hypothetical protein